MGCVVLGESTTTLVYFCERTGKLQMLITIAQSKIRWEVGGAPDHKRLCISLLINIIIFQGTSNQ